jgi:flagellar export protein FliJ
MLPRLVERRRTLAQSRGEVAQQIEAARAALAEAFQEVKRHETVVAGRARQQRLREERRDQRVLDDLGAEGFRRRRAGQE